IRRTRIRSRNSSIGISVGWTTMSARAGLRLSGSPNPTGNARPQAGLLVSGCGAAKHGMARRGGHLTEFLGLLQSIRLMRNAGDHRDDLVAARLRGTPHPDLNAATQNADAVREAEDLIETMADEQHREIALLEAADDLLDLGRLGDA